MIGENKCLLGFLFHAPFFCDFLPVSYGFPTSVVPLKIALFRKPVGKDLNLNLLLAIHVSATSSFHSPANSSSSFRAPFSSRRPAGVAAAAWTACKNNREKRKPPEPCNESTVWGRHLSTNPNQLQEENRDVSSTFGKSSPLLRFLSPDGEMQKLRHPNLETGQGSVREKEKKE